MRKPTSTSNATPPATESPMIEPVPIAPPLSSPAAADVVEALADDDDETVVTNVSVAGSAVGSNVGVERRDVTALGMTMTRDVDEDEDEDVVEVVEGVELGVVVDTGTVRRALVVVAAVVDGGDKRSN